MSSGASLPGWIAEDPASRQLAALARRAAERARTLLITGETGTGKAALARAIHQGAAPADAPFVVLGCSTLPEGLAESELFGHEADAFSGASGRRPGRFEQARGGTILLHHVEDLPVSIQGKLLRVLQERRVERVGGRRSLAIDARIVATSRVDLARLVEHGTFREDLYYRLEVVRLELAPLRERPGDVEPLARAFLAELGRRLERAPVLAPDAVAWLTRQAWPGNVRQLRNVLERAVTLESDDRVSLAVLERALERPRTSPDRAIAELAERRLSLRQLEALYVARVLETTGGRVGKAADILGIHRKTLLEKRKRHGLD